jgi:outer membrane protein assembly factor BamB
VHCLDSRTGKAHWTHDTKDRVYGHPLVVDGKIYVGSDAGEVWIYSLEREKKVLAQIEHDSIMSAPLVYANGTLYVMTELRLHAIAKTKTK